MKKYKSKTRQEVKDAGLEGEEHSENEELLEELTDRFEESERGMEANAQKRQSDIENKKRKLKKWEKR